MIFMSKKSIESKCLRFLKNSSSNTIKSYIQAINKYENFHGLTTEELVLEALDEQDKQVPQHRLKIIERIESFQDWLMDQDYVIGTIRHHLIKIKSIYRKNRILIPYIEPINPHLCNKRETIEYTDILTKEEIKTTLPLMRLPLQARVMVMVQGGLSNEECEHLTTRLFIDETYPYHQKENDLEALEWLQNENNPIIWVTKLIRVKTGKPYYALIGAEAVNKIASAKLYEYNLRGVISDKLLNTHKLSLNRACSEINSKCGFGKAGNTNRFRPHMLRKFHATYIRGSVLSYEENSLTLSQIDELQGRGKTSVQDTYIKTNPFEQKILYAKVMNNVSLYHEYEYEIVDGDVIIRVKDPLLETRKLRDEVKNLSHQLENKRRASLKVQKLRKELGDDAFKELIGEILNGF